MADNHERHQVFEEISGFVRAVQKINDIAAAEYKVLVEDVISGRITDEPSIERIMDGLMSFCDSPECLELFKRLCRHTLYKHPEMTIDYVNCYRALYEEQEEGSEQ